MLIFFDLVRFFCVTKILETDIFVRNYLTPIRYGKIRAIQTHIIFLRVNILTDKKYCLWSLYYGDDDIQADLLTSIQTCIHLKKYTVKNDRVL